VPPKSTADLANWRELYPAPLTNPTNLKWWDDTRNLATAALSSVNKMPGVYDPANFIGATPQQQGAAINPAGPAQKDPAFSAAVPSALYNPPFKNQGMTQEGLLASINQTPGLLQALQGLSSQIEGGANPGTLLAQLLAQPITQA